MDSEDTDSEEESYNTPPESNQEEEVKESPIVVEENVDPIDAIIAEFTDDEFEKDSLFDNESEIEELMNNPSNDTAVEFGNLLNLPQILDIQGKQEETSSSDDQNSRSTQRTHTK